MGHRSRQNKGVILSVILSISLIAFMGWAPSAYSWGSLTPAKTHQYILTAAYQSLSADYDVLTGPGPDSKGSAKLSYAAPFKSLSGNFSTEVTRHLTLSNEDWFDPWYYNGDRETLMSETSSNIAWETTVVTSAPPKKETPADSAVVAVNLDIYGKAKFLNPQVKITDPVHLDYATTGTMHCPGEGVSWKGNAFSANCTFTARNDLPTPPCWDLAEPVNLVDVSYQAKDIPLADRREADASGYTHGKIEYVYEFYELKGKELQEKLSGLKYSRRYCLHPGLTFDSTEMDSLGRDAGTLQIVLRKRK